MTRKDYKRAADIICGIVEAPPDNLRSYLARRFADIFAEDNQLFNRGKFYAACKVTTGSLEVTQ